MWTASDLQRARITLDDAPARARFDAVVVAVDPSSSEAASSDYTGIVVMGRTEGPDGLRGYVLHSERMHALAPEWGVRVAQLYREWAADVVVVEANMAIAKDVLRLIDPTIPVRKAYAVKRKWLRAEPLQVVYSKAACSTLAITKTWSGRCGGSRGRACGMIWSMPWSGRRGRYRSPGAACAITVQRKTIANRWSRENESRRCPR